MSFFKLLDSERSEGVCLKVFIKDLARQEKVPESEVAAILLREYEEEVPFHEQFEFYYHDVVKSFVVANKSYCKAALTKIAYGDSLDETSFTLEVEVSHGIIENKNICIKATEMAMFLIDVHVNIPNCLSHVENIAYDKYYKKYDLNGNNQQAPNMEVGVTTDINEEEPTEWNDFKGKSTAMTLIAGLSLALTRSHNGCRHRNGKPNKSAIAAVAANSVMSAGYLVDIVSDRQLRGLIGNALETCDFGTTETLPKS